MSRPAGGGVGLGGRSTQPETGITVSVLTPTLNEAAHVANMVRCVQDQRLDARVEFLFIDGRSDDGTRTLLERFARADPRIRVLDNPRRGIPHALNIGLRSARGEFVARMDAHTLYPPDYLAHGIEHLRRGEADWVAGPQIPHGTDTGSRRAALALSTRLGVGGASFRNATREIEADSGYTGVWRRDTLVRLGGWDEGWAVNEDGELAARIRERGGRIICVPEMGARYVPRNRLRSLARQYWRYGQFRAKTCRAHPNSMRRSHVLAPALALAVPAAVLPLRRVSGAARLALLAYGVALGATATRRLPSAGARDSAAIPPLLATIHLAWGVGFLVGSARFGPPLGALGRLACGTRRSADPQGRLQPGPRAANRLTA
jgi:succinoglycan biosynthesis protein ExoA